MYDVPKGSAGALVNAIRDVMWTSENKAIGRAVVTPDGRLVVLAAPGIQSGVQTLVEEVAKHPPQGAQTVELHLFSRAREARRDPATSIPLGVGEIAQALDEVEPFAGAAGVHPRAARRALVAAR